jgi:hypothetical protein
MFNDYVFFSFNLLRHSAQHTRTVVMTNVVPSQTTLSYIKRIIYDAHYNSELFRVYLLLFLMKPLF